MKMPCSQVIRGLGYGAESHRKVRSSRLGFAIWRQENCLSTQGTFCKSEKDKAAKKEGWAPPFISCAQNKQLFYIDI